MIDKIIPCRWNVLLQNIWYEDNKFDKPILLMSNKIQATELELE